MAQPVNVILTESRVARYGLPAYGEIRQESQTQMGLLVEAARLIPG